MALSRPRSNSFQDFMMSPWRSLSELGLQTDEPELSLKRSISLDIGSEAIENCESEVQSPEKTHSFEGKAPKCPATKEPQHHVLITILPQENCCRFCYERETKDEGRLIAPCKYDGSLKYIHEKCLQKWILQMDTEEILTKSIRCELCLYKYKLKVTKDAEFKWSRALHRWGFLIAGLLFAFLFLGSMIWPLFVNPKDFYYPLFVLNGFLSAMFSSLMIFCFQNTFVEIKVLDVEILELPSRKRASSQCHESAIGQNANGDAISKCDGIEQNEENSTPRSPLDQSQLFQNSSLPMTHRQLLVSDISQITMQIST